MAAGGLGISGGMLVLGGLVTGPALAVLGTVVGAKASANRDKAYSNLSRARAFKEEMDVAADLCIGIKDRAIMFDQFLESLNSIFTKLIDEMTQTIKNRGNDYAKFSEEEKKIVAETLAMAGAVKSILDTPILDSDGNLTIESEKIIAKTRRRLKLA